MAPGLKARGCSIGACRQEAGRSGAQYGGACAQAGQKRTACDRFLKHGFSRFRR
jgi:hypothetical protein